MPIRLPAHWHAYHHDNLIAFFAGPPSEPSLRWIAEIHPQQSENFVFWRITTPQEPLELADFTPDYDRYRQVLRDAASAFKNLSREPQVEDEGTAAAVQVSIDLGATTFGAVTQSQTFSRWIQELTPRQLEFVTAPTDRSIRLRGPAGTGKTLALELKALREVYEAADRGADVRVLFVTHSWSVATQVDAALHQLDDRGLAEAIDVWPLLALPEYLMPQEQGSRFKLLGEDSFKGKSLQLERIAESTEFVRTGDWLAMRGQVSNQLRERVETIPGSPEKNALVWDLMIEFASVIFAQGILPGVNAERQYLGIQRAPWMMPLKNDADKGFVLAVFTHYVRALRSEGFLTSDQRVNDFLNYLETFAWDFRRQDEGFDLIFVDELQLFTDQERLTLHYLTRTADEYPRMFMASDPRQAPYEVYGLSISGPVSNETHELLDSNEARVIELSTVHRFTPEILALVKHIHEKYPALDLGTEWELDMGAVESAVANGPIPRLAIHPDDLLETGRVVHRAASALNECGPNERVAIIVLDPARLATFEKELALAGSRFRTVRGRDEVEMLQYSKKAVVLTAAEYVGGLQFHTVLIAGVPDVKEGVANQGYRLRQFLSLLYLAVSRATDRVEIHVNDIAGGVPGLLESAVEKGILTAN